MGILVGRTTPHIDLIWGFTKLKQNKAFHKESSKSSPKLVLFTQFKVLTGWQNHVV